MNPFTIELLCANRLAVDDLRSKASDESGKPGAPEMDLVITVCDQAGGETCPVWPGHTITAHWSFEDPAAFQEGDGEKSERFQQVYRQIMTRMRLLMNLPLWSLDRLASEQKISAIGQVKP